MNPLLAAADRVRDGETGRRPILALGTARRVSRRASCRGAGYELVTDARGCPSRAARPAPPAGAPRRVAAERSPATQQSMLDPRRRRRRRRLRLADASAPAYVAAWRSHVPLAVHEANAKPGIANVLGSWFARHVGAVPGQPTAPPPRA